MRDYTTEELRERKRLTDAIVCNLKEINEDGNSIDYLNELEELSGTIAANLKEIAENEADMDAMKTSTDEIVKNLATIGEAKED